MKRYILFSTAIIFLVMFASGAYAACDSENRVGIYSKDLNGVRTWQTNSYGWNMVGVPGATINYNSRHGPDSEGSMVVYTAGGNPNPQFLELYDTQTFPTIYDGIYFWVKGDGSSGTGTIGIGGAATYRYNFPLSNDTWHQVYAPFSSFNPPATGTPWLVYFSVYNNGNEAYYYIDNVTEYSGSCSPDPANIIPGPDPGVVNVLDHVYNTTHISATLNKMQNQQPTKIIIMGDSITEGAQLWYTQNDTQYMFVTLLNNSLKNYYGYNGVDVSKVSQSGQMTGWGIAQLPGVISQNPDLVVWFLGTNNCIGGGANDADYDTHTRQAVQDLQANGIDVVLAGIIAAVDTQWCSYDVQHPNYIQMAQDIARDYNIAFIDTGSLFRERGYVYLGDLYSDQYHPNHRGHEYIHRALYSTLTGQNTQLWDDVPGFLLTSGGSQNCSNRYEITAQCECDGVTYSSGYCCYYKVYPVNETNITHQNNQCGYTEVSPHFNHQNRFFYALGPEAPGVVEEMARKLDVIVSEGSPVIRQINPNIKTYSYIDGLFCSTGTCEPLKIFFSERAWDYEEAFLHYNKDSVQMLDGSGNDNPVLDYKIGARDVKETEGQGVFIFDGVFNDVTNEIFASALTTAFCDSPNEIIYFGSYGKFKELSFIFSTPASADYQGVWEYWNGNVWASFSPRYDTTNDLTQDGKIDFWPLPLDWQPDFISDEAWNDYWIRLRSTNCGAQNPIIQTVTGEDYIIATPNFGGHKYSLIPGWTYENDADTDFIRDYEADSGYASSWTDYTLTDLNENNEHDIDLTKNWVSDQWIGFNVYDYQGNAYSIISNTVNQLQLDTNGPSISSALSIDPIYYIDHPNAADHNATAMFYWHSKPKATWRWHDKSGFYNKHEQKFLDYMKNITHTMIFSNPNGHIFDGIYFDDLGCSPGGGIYASNSIEYENYSDKGQAWRDGINLMVREVKDNLQQTDPSKRVGGNTCEQSYIDYWIDGDMDFQLVEFWHKIVGGSPPRHYYEYNPSNPVTRILMGPIFGAQQGQQMLLQGYTGVSTWDNLQHKMFSYAVYLTIMGDDLYYSWTTGRYSAQWDTGETAWMEAYNYDLGKPILENNYINGTPAYYILDQGTQDGKEYIIYAREFENALVLFKPWMEYNSGGPGGDETRTNHNLNDTYMLLNVNGTLQPLSSTVSLRAPDGAILIKQGIQTCYDVNNDAVVNIIDLVLVIFHQGRNSGQGDWSDYQHLDVVQDDVIDFADVSSVITSFSQSC